MRRTATVAALLSVAVPTSACGGGNLASSLATQPEWKPTDQTQCAVIANRAKPLIVEWPSADRGQLETRIRGKGLVAVAYSGCRMKVLDRCTAEGQYAYTPLTKKSDHVVMRDTDDLYANVPLGAARLEAKLKKSGELDVGMTMSVAGTPTTRPATRRV